MSVVYVIQSQTTGKRYVGYTSDLELRLQYHNGELLTKTTSYTKKNTGPWVPVYTERFESKIEAMKRERELKTSRGRAFIKLKLLGA